MFMGLLRRFCLFLFLLPAWALAQVVCIDPGHPSEVGRGTQGKKLTELHANWVQAQLLKQRLEKRGIKVIMTKPREQKLVRNQDRAGVANAARADLMIRLHCDASSGTGFTVYAPNQQGTDRNFRGPSSKIIQESQTRAKRFHVAMAEALKGRLKDNGLHPDQHTAVGSRHGALVGSIYSRVPVILVEMVVLTNPKDEAYLLSGKGQSEMADALEAGVMAALGR
jgi:N-acetylmuramoyl-L-alanine amidase